MNWMQEVQVRVRMYARHHVMFAVAGMMISTVVFLFNIQSFMNSGRRVSNPPGWREEVGVREKGLHSILTPAPPVARTIHKTRLTVVVLTCNRPKSLERLLVSLTSARYEKGSRVDLIVRQDLPESGVPCAETARLVHRMFWPHGTLDHAREESRRGPMHMWLHAYVPSGDSDFFLVLEDDMEVGAFYHRWLMPALEHFRVDTSVMGVSLAKPVERGVDPLGLGPVASSVPKEAMVVKYRVASQEALSPIPRQWGAFARWVLTMEKKFDPTEVGDPWLRDLRSFERYREFRQIGNPGVAWVAFLQRFMVDSSLYVLHPWCPDGLALARSWREAGAVRRRAEGPREELLDTWEPGMVRWRPRNTVRLDYNGRVMV